MKRSQRAGPGTSRGSPYRTNDSPRACHCAEFHGQTAKGQPLADGAGVDGSIGMLAGLSQGVGG